jgi:hypothetical protein
LLLWLASETGWRWLWWIEQRCVTYYARLFQRGGRWEMEHNESVYAWWQRYTGTEDTEKIKGELTMEHTHYDIGDRIPINEHYPEIVTAFVESMQMAQEMMESAATLKIKANAEFWASFHDLFPGGDHLSWRINPNTGECIAISTTEAMIAKQKMAFGMPKES